MKSEKVIGALFILGAVGVFVPYLILTMNFDYPDILRQDPGTILTQFHNGGPTLILTWFCFALLGLPLIAAYILLGQKLESKSRIVRLATTLGIISAIVQIIGLLRWTFVVPMLANTYVTAGNDTTKETATIIFQSFHQFGGVLLGEHLGQLFTVAWTLMICVTFAKLQIMPKWIIWLGFISATIYLLAQAELLSTVIPGFPNWEMAGLIGSSLWLIWLIVIGISFFKGIVEHKEH